MHKLVVFLIQINCFFAFLVTVAVAVETLNYPILLSGSVSGKAPSLIFGLNG